MRQLLVVLCCLAACTVHAETRLYLLSQYDWGKKTGFYVDFEGDKLATLPLTLGVADGKDWKFTGLKPGFVTGREYAIRATIGGGTNTLELDGKQVGEMKMAWQPSALPRTTSRRGRMAITTGCRR
jgi:hypothetical protein